MSRPLILATLAAGALLGVAGSALAYTPSDILQKRKTPPSSQAIALPMAEHPPAYCDPERAGWMYLDISMRDAGALGCVCVQDKDLTWQWATFGSVVRECD